VTFSFPICETWYCIAYLQIGGLLEMTVPFGIILVTTALVVLIVGWK
jgi:hypothetical protein